MVKFVYMLYGMLSVNQCFTVVWLRRSISPLVRSTRVGSDLVVETTNHKPTVNSAVHPSEVGK